MVTARRQSPTSARGLIASFRPWALVWLLWPLFVAGTAYGQQVEATVDAQEVGPRDQVTLTVQVTGGSPKTPEFPRMTDWRVQFIGQQTSFTAVNMNFTRSVSYNYLLSPRREGTLTIPPITVVVEGRPLRTEPIQVVVGGGSSAPDVQSPDAVPTDDVFVEIELEPREVFVGQPVIQRLKIYSAVSTAAETQVARRPIPGTYEEQLTDQQSQRRYMKTLLGRRFQVEEASWILYPISAGPLTVPSMTVTVPIIEQGTRQRGSRNPFDDFFGPMRTVVPREFVTEEQILKVLPIPEDGRPADYAGLVGRFKVTAGLSERSVTLGDPVTLTVTIEGDGNVRSLSLPLPAAPDLKVYEDTPELEVSVGKDTLPIGRKTFKWAIVPQRAGTITVPSVTFSYFNPEQRRFEPVSTQPFELQVQPGPGGQQAIAGRRTTPSSPEEPVQATGNDLLPIHTGPALTADRHVALASPRAAGFLLFPVALFAIAASLRRVQDARSRNPEQRRRRQALQVASAELKALEAGPSVGGRAGLDRLSRTVRSYLGFKLNREGGALTASEARALLAAAGVAEALAKETELLLDQLEQARYAPGEGAQAVTGLVAQARGLLERLDKVLG